MGENLYLPSTGQLASQKPVVQPQLPTMLREEARRPLEEAERTADLEIRKALHRQAFELAQAAHRLEAAMLPWPCGPVIGYPRRPPNRREKAHGTAMPAR